MGQRCHGLDKRKKNSLVFSGNKQSSWRLPQICIMLSKLVIDESLSHDNHLGALGKLNGISDAWTPPYYIRTYMSIGKTCPCDGIRSVISVEGHIPFSLVAALSITQMSSSGLLPPVTQVSFSWFSRMDNPSTTQANLKIEKEAMRLIPVHYSQSQLSWSPSVHLGVTS